MIAVVYGPHYRNWGTIPKSDGTSFKQNGFRNHPCTVWSAKTLPNLAWLISHAIGLCDEYTLRYNKVHSLTSTVLRAREMFIQRTGLDPDHVWDDVTEFARAMPDELKTNQQIDDVTAYRLYVNTKPWVSGNYIRLSSRKPSWVS
jgi:hypothetical protein